MVAGFAEVDPPAFPALVGDRAGAGEALDGRRGRETLALVAEHHQEFGLQEGAGAGK